MLLRNPTSRAQTRSLAMSEPIDFDLDAYLERVGYEGEVAPTLGTLRQLHLAHLRHIPFENLDVRLGRRLSLNLEALQDKLVRRRRGGYCFEQNGLFAAALRVIGFQLDTLEARVRPPGAVAPLPRTHMVLRVEVERRSWLADVGFGGEGPLEPVPLDGRISEQPGDSYRIAFEPDEAVVLCRRVAGDWRDLYAFTLRPAFHVDYEVAHHFTSTHPRSPFVNTLTIQRTDDGVRYVLRGRSYTERRGEDEVRRELSDDEVVVVIKEKLNLEVPEDDVRQALGSG
jgi:N-hydroxyarylamine O-acetyltransferase